MTSMDDPQHFLLQAEALLLFLAALTVGGLGFWNARHRRNGYRSARILTGIACSLLGLIYLFTLFTSMDLTDFTVVSRLLLLMALLGWLGREMRDL